MERRGAMQLSMSMIIVVVLSLMVLILGFFMVNKLMCGSIIGIESLNDNMKNEVLSLFGSNDGIVIKERENDVYKGVSYGVGFAIRDTGEYNNPKYRIEVSDLGDCSISEREADSFIFLGKEGDVIFDSNGEYVDLIKFKISEDVSPCEMRYKIILYSGDSIYDAQNFEIKILNKKFTQNLCSVD
ncbi:MAG: hypothetical protein OQK82_01945 [Candidatus Pacearchaeota archaeon]|nr:hypothetical protein [Candidatus Pacearchaeota archaeon]